MTNTDPGPFIFGVPQGRQLDEEGGGYAPGVIGNLWGLSPADEFRLRQARQHFIQVAGDDFDQEGKDFIDRATGKRYRVVTFDPTLSDDPKDTGVELFFKTWDERIAYLMPVGAESRTKSVHIGYARSGGS